MSEETTGRLLLELLPQRKQSPRTPRSVPVYSGREDGSPRPPATAIGASMSPRTPRCATPSWLSAGSKELPSERATARALRLSVARMSKAQPAEAGVQLVRATGLQEEYHLLDTCIKQLVKQLATRCVEWGEVLEVVRGRLCSLWARAWRSLLSLEAGEQPRADGAGGGAGGPARRLARPAEPEGADATGTVGAGVDAARAGAEEGGQPANAGALANYAAAVEVVGVSVRAGARVGADGYDAALSPPLTATPTPTPTPTPTLAPGSRAHGDPRGARGARSQRGEAAGGRAAAQGEGY